MTEADNNTLVAGCIQYGVVGSQAPPSSASHTAFTHTHARSVPNVYNPSTVSSQSLDLSSHSHSPLVTTYAQAQAAAVNRTPSRSSRPKSLGALPKMDTSTLTVASASTRTSAEDDSTKLDSTSESGERSASSFVVIRKPRSQVLATQNGPPNSSQPPSIPPVPPVPPLPIQQKSLPPPLLMPPQQDYLSDWQMATLSGGLKLALTNPDAITDNDP